MFLNKTSDYLPGVDRGDASVEVLMLHKDGSFHIGRFQFSSMRWTVPQKDDLDTDVFEKDDITHWIALPDYPYDHPCYKK